MKADFGEMKAELHAREARLIKWVAGLVVAGAAAPAGMAIAVNQIFGPGVRGLIGPHAGRETTNDVWRGHRPPNE